MLRRLVLPGLLASLSLASPAFAINLIVVSQTTDSGMLLDRDSVRRTGNIVRLSSFVITPTGIAEDVRVRWMVTEQEFDCGASTTRYRMLRHLGLNGVILQQWNAVFGAWQNPPPRTPTASILSLVCKGEGASAMPQIASLEAFETRFAKGPTQSASPEATPSANPALKIDAYEPSDRAANSRLDNWVISLQQDPSMQGYLISYGGRTSRPGDAKKAADKAMAYVTKVRRLDPARIHAIDGGQRDLPTIELWGGPQGSAPPEPTPTVPAKGVKPKP